jgi:hypothetical protein
MFHKCPSLVILPEVNFDLKNISSKENYI